MRFREYITAAFFSPHLFGLAQPVFTCIIYGQLMLSVGSQHNLISFYSSHPIQGEYD